MLVIPAAREMINFGSYSVFKSTKYIILCAAGNLNRYDTFKNNNVNYQVPLGKTLKLLAAKIKNASGTYSAGVQLGHGTAAVNNDLVAPAAFTSLTTNAATLNAVGISETTLGNEVDFVFSGQLVAQNLYPCIFVPATSYVAPTLVTILGELF